MSDTYSRMYYHIVFAVKYRKNHIDKLVPSIEITEVEQLLAEMDEAAQVLRVKNNVPMGGIFDVRMHARRAQIGGALSPVELMEVASTIRASARRCSASRRGRLPGGLTSMETSIK